MPLKPLALAAALLALVGCKRDADALDPASLPPATSLVDALERVLPELTSPVTRARVLVGIAEGEVAGGSEIAAARLSAATVATREVEMPSQQASLRTRLVELWCRVGQVEQARTVTREIASAELRSEAQVSLTRALVAAKRIEDAEAVARSIEVARHRGAALLEVVRGHLAAGRRPAGGKLIAAFRGLPERDEALAEVAQAYADAGELPQVNGALDDIRSPHWRGAAQVALARLQFRKGARKMARDTVAQIESEWMRVRGLADMYVAARAKGRKKAAARHLRRAKKRAAGISDPLMRSAAQADIVTRLVSTDRFEEAEALVAELPDIGTRRKAEADLVARYAEGGRFEDAHRLLQLVEKDALWGGLAAGALARALAEAGRVDDALRAVARIRAPDLRLPTLGYVAAIQAAKAEVVTDAQIEAARTLLGHDALP